MRIKRSLQLWPSSATVHLYWRCHNKEFYLESQDSKDLYLKCLEDGLTYKDQWKNCRIHSYCAMGNHFHQSVSYQNGSANLSNFMRYSHSLFGARYNRCKKRSGKVAEGRPKTPRIQNASHEMRVHFYIEANPIRAGFRKIENLKGYIYSSYGFYAYGKRTKFTHLITIPEWYVNLGRNTCERQRIYRKLFREYLGIYSEEFSSLFKKVFVGDPLWIMEAGLYLRSFLKSNLVAVRGINSPLKLDST